MKAGAKVVKVCGKKKINHYNKSQCQSELARLEGLKDFNSKYKQEIEKHLATL